MNNRSNNEFSQQFSIALIAYNQGLLAEAKKQCHSILALQPRHYDSLRMAAMIAYREKNYTESLKLFNSALSVKSDPEILNAIGLLYKNLGQKEGAETAFKQCSILFNSPFECTLNLALLYITLKRYSEAIPYLKTCLTKNKNDGRSLINLALCLTLTDRSTDAKQYLDEFISLVRYDHVELENAAIYLCSAGAYQHAVKLALEIINDDPLKITLLKQIGIVAMKSNDFVNAASALEAGLQFDPNDKLLLNNLGLAENNLNKKEKAIALLKRAVTIDPSYADALSNLASVLSDDKKDEEAITYSRQALVIDPYHVNAMINLAKSLTLTKDLKGAKSILMRALSIDPDNFLAHSNLGNVYNRLGQFEDSIKEYQKSLEIAHQNNHGNERMADSLFNIGIGLDKLGKNEAAGEYYARSSSLDQSNKDCLFNMGINELTQGRFERAWHHYFFRPRVLHPGVTLTPLNPTLDFTGKKILIVAGQGFGDELLFMRFIESIRKKCAHITYLADKKLSVVLENVAGLDSVVTELSGTSPFDVTISMDDLPLILEINSAEKIPPPVKISATLDNLKSARNLLQKHGDPPYLAFTWRAGTTDQKNGYNYQILKKEVRLELLVDTLKEFSFTFINIQRNPLPEELTALDKLFKGRTLINAFRYNDELDKMLGILDCVDEYVAVSNTNVHLRAALGKSSRVLVPFPPEWRWLDKGRHSPWYRDIPLYRETHELGWKPALSDLRLHLSKNTLESL